MVAPIGNIANKFSFSSTILNTSTTTLNDNSSTPTMSSVNSIEMDIQTGQISVPNSTMRGRNLFSSTNISRESLLASLGQSTPYYDRMDTDMDFPPPREDSNLELSYETEQEKAIWVSMVANQ